MKYIIMILIVIGLAIADFITGIIKAYVNDDIKSIKMRKGGMNKLAEIVVMGVAVGSEVGFELLGKYYGHEQLASIAGTITAISVFLYIFSMEIVSILENFGDINPQASWVKKFIQKLGNFSNDNDERK